MKKLCISLTDNEHKMLKMFAASKGLSMRNCLMSFFRERIENNEEYKGISFENLNKNNNNLKQD